MKISCHGPVPMVIQVEVTPIDLERLDAIFTAVRGMLEVGADAARENGGYHRLMVAGDIAVSPASKGDALRPNPNHSP